MLKFGDKSRAFVQQTFELANANKLVVEQNMSGDKLILMKVGQILSIVQQNKVIIDQI
ncbi:MAG: hypothetical protein H7Z37_02335 [Pyrinomonadaceae bacterium]|nr:hypothetical protein [Pyrinomonadaceae bacterium]